MAWIRKWHWGIDTHGILHKRSIHIKLFFLKATFFSRHRLLYISYEVYEDELYAQGLYIGVFQACLQSLDESRLETYLKPSIYYRAARISNLLKSTSRMNSFELTVGFRCSLDIVAVSPDRKMAGSVGKIAVTKKRQIRQFL